MLLSPYSSSTSNGVGEAIGVTIAVMLYIAFIAFAVYMYMRVAKKAGWTLWHGLLVLVPVANLVFVIMFVFMEWPIERRVREAEARLAQLTGMPYDGSAPGYGAPAYDSYGYGAPAAPAYGAPAYGAPAYGTPEHPTPAPSPYDTAPPVPPYEPPPAPGAPPATDVPPR
ncbi:hypothetical protein [Cellulomonas sp. S1-8]|uniref:hypothetical protein n=1 Tax=Cellulomonas sp. S1-8 TaxID=2904790 RepID=UPI002243C4B5|nr:hypothetical protein [Cellulomonas sp. S1-8]UZN05435.1 hypothetical protein OKX07_03815 [Cellulomonas sp. S1-8]